MDNITIRPAAKPDAPAIARLLAQITEVHHALRPDIFRESYQNPDACGDSDWQDDAPVFVAATQHDVVGCLWCIMNRERDNALKLDRDWLIIDDICVDEKYRRRGIGKKLLDFACRFARDSGLDRIELNVYEANSGAVRFYENNGFTTQKRVMELNLSVGDFSES